MRPNEKVAFIGLFGSFPLSKGSSHVPILQTILEIGVEPNFKRIKYGLLKKKLASFPYSKERLEEALQSVSVGTADYLELGDNLLRSLETSILLTWKSSIVEPYKRELSPVEKRFGNSGEIEASFPLSRFDIDAESDFQKKLLSGVKRVFVEEHMHWAFIHKGLRLVAPHSVGADEIFQASKDGFPVTGFEWDLNIQSAFFSEFVKGAFWANFLNPFHVRKLGGIERLKSERPCKIIEELGNETVMLQVGASPLTVDELKAGEDYQRLRRFLKPILMETDSERMRIQREVLGPWKPPASADRDFAETRRRFQSDLRHVDKG